MNNTIDKLNAVKNLTNGLKDVKQAQDFINSITIENENEIDAKNLITDLLIEREIALIDNYKATL